MARDVGRLSQARLVPLPEAPGAAYRYDAAIGGKGVRDVHASADGELWFAQNNGLGHLDDGRFRVYSIDHGITGDALNAITPDANGSLWIGTDTNGASRLERGGFATYSIENRAQRGWVTDDLGGSARNAVRDRRHDRRDQLFREQPVRAGAIERPSVSGFGEPRIPTAGDRGSSGRLVGSHGGGVVPVSCG